MFLSLVKIKTEKNQIDRKNLYKITVAKIGPTTETKFWKKNLGIDLNIISCVWNLKAKIFSWNH